MEISRANINDIEGLDRLLLQVLTVHHNGRPDLFKANCRKYNKDELKALLNDDIRPVFAAFDDSGYMLGYAFCIIEQRVGDNVLCDMKTLYIDDLCVDETARGKHIGKALYEYCVDFARKICCYNLTLNVWECNDGAKRFYETMGLKPYKTCMEKLL